MTEPQIGYNFTTDDYPNTILKILNIQQTGIGRILTLDNGVQYAYDFGLQFGKNMSVINPIIEPIVINPIMESIVIEEPVIKEPVIWQEIVIEKPAVTTMEEPIIKKPIQLKENNIVFLVIVIIIIYILLMR